MVTIYDIAKICGLAPSTVSKALNNYRSINTDTIARVSKIAKELGYLPNASARNLITKKTENIGILIDIPDVVGLNHSMFMSILNAFKTTLEKEKYDITFMSKINANSYLNHCRTKGFDGVLVLGDFSSPEVAEVIQSDFPTVCFDYTGADACGVESNNYECTINLTNHLINLGHKRILYIEGEYNHVTNNRHNAFLKAMADANLACDGLIKLGHYYSVDDMYQLVYDFMKTPNDITAIMFPDDHAAIGGMNALIDLGYKIPEDISITGYDGIEISQIIKPKLTTVKQNAQQIGEKLASTLLNLIKRKQPSHNTSAVIPATLIIGESTAIAKK